MTGLTPEIVDIDPQDAVAVRGDVAIADLPSFFERAFTTAAEAIVTSGAEIVGPPFAFYPEMPTATVAVEAGFPVSKLVGDVVGTHPLVLPGGTESRHDDWQQTRR